MKVTGIIAEYNPFHRGHEYHIMETRRITGADYCVIVMSGDFVQRGEPAILDKYTRAEMALRCGADLVIELPVAYATASAERFAWGAVSLLHSLGIVDVISCGCEQDSEMIHTIAAVLAEEPERYRLLLKQNLKEGNSFPAARETALFTYFQEQNKAQSGEKNDDTMGSQNSGYRLQEAAFSASALHDLISSPNAILALEYEKAIRRLHSHIRLQLIERKGSYHAEDFPALNTLPADRTLTFASAAAVRKFLLQNQTELSDLHKNRDGIQALPEQVITILQHRADLMEKNDFSSMLGYALLARRNGDLTRYQDVTPELANRLLNQLTYYQNWDHFSEMIKTKQITKTHIDRALLHLLLGMQKENMDFLSLPLYARILGFRTSAAPVLKEIKRHSSIPALTKLADAEKTLQKRYEDDLTCRQVLPAAIVQLQQDIFAADLYETAKAGKYSVPKRNEYRQEIIRI